MSESYEDRQKRLKLQREKAQGRRERKAREEHKSQVELFFSPKKQESYERTIEFAPKLPEHSWERMFAQMLQAYFGAMYQQSRYTLHPLAQGTPKQIPLNWQDLFRDVLRDDHVRASSAINFFGICQQKTLLERIEEKTKYFGVGERPRAMRHGTDMHKKLEDAERELGESYRSKGRPVSFEKDALCGYQGLAFVQEASFEAAFDVRGREVKLTGHPDRVLSAGNAVFILEAKTNLFRFSPPMVLGACIQDLLYGLLVEQYVGRPVVLALTESTRPLERSELDYLAVANDAGFVRALAGSGKAALVTPFTKAHRQLALYFLDQMVAVSRSPRLAAGAAKETCERYECPFRNRGCEFYQK